MFEVAAWTLKNNKTYWSIARQTLSHTLEFNKNFLNLAEVYKVSQNIKVILFFVVPKSLPIKNLSCFCCVQLTGVLDDCFCDVESIDVFNNFKIYPRIKKLIERDYFRYYRVSVAALHTQGSCGRTSFLNRIRCKLYWNKWNAVI